MNNQKKASEILFEICGNCKEDEKILIVTDPNSLSIAQKLYNETSNYKNRTLMLMEETGMHGSDPTDIVKKAMYESDVIFGCTTFSLFHSPARRKASENGARFVNMVDYNMDMLIKGGLFADFKEMGEVCLNLANVLDNKKDCHITTEIGTDLTCSIENRKPNPQIGRSPEKGMVSSPPDVECATCAVEGTANGIIIVDGSIPFPGLGLIKEPIKLTVLDGQITKIEGGDEAKKLEEILKNVNDPCAYTIGEIGIGLNPECRLSGSMLEDEGTSGTIHFACGDNRSFGGHTECKIHLDMVIRNPNMYVDGELIISKGVLKI